MAELVVFNIAKSLLPQLSSLAKDELLLWYNSKTELKKLENTITTIKDVLHDAEQRQATDAAVQGWLFRLRDTMYKADDLFDSISTRALRKRVMSGNKILKETRLFFSKSNHFAFVVSTARKVKKLREKLDDIAKDMNQFGFIRTAIADNRPIIKKKAQSHSYIRDDEVIGREEDKEEILRLLFKDPGVEQCVSVIAVVGIGGLGKTALSQLVYNAKEVKEFFDLRLWACVNYFTNLKDALEDVLGVKKPTLEELQTVLRKQIQGKKFLLVLDDVWDDIRERWLGLKALLDVGERGSKVLVTTRLTTVAQNLATVTPYYTLRGLSDEHAWFLFKKTAFDNKQEEDYQAKEEWGRQIVKKCANVPLAIRTMGSYLYRKDKKKWSDLVDNRVMNEMRDHPENMIMEVLKISYDDLPSSLKHCFVYCSLFPEDYIFDNTTLIHLWMSQGFLQSSDENELIEDVGERYFQCLAERCFFQNFEVGEYGLIRCKMHDLFHSLAVKIDGKECVDTKQLGNMKGKSHRHLRVRDIDGLPLHGKGIRSLMSPVSGLIKGSVLDGLFMKFTSLRTLSLQQLETDELPSSIGKLVHLRYLDLRDSRNLKRLPASLCKIQNLLILMLGGCSKLMRLPDDIQKLVCLRYLEIGAYNQLDRTPARLEEMTSLVRLDRLIVNKDHGGLRCLKHLNNLTGALQIDFKRGLSKNCVADAEESMLSRKTKLSKLEISFCNSREGEEMADADAVLDRLQPHNNLSNLCVLYFPGVKFPDWISSLTNLVTLYLTECISCLEIPRLSQLCQLKSLNLMSMDLLEYVGNDISNDGGGGSFFPALQSLYISSMPSLKGWWRPARGEVSSADQFLFARLSALEVHGCPQLTCLPGCPSLESLSLSFVNVNLVTQLVPEIRELEANNAKLDLQPDEFKHVPALRHLEISKCPNLKRHSVFRSLQYLPCLETLVFRGFTEIEEYIDDDDKEGIPWISLTRLKSLGFEFGNDPQGAHLFNGLHHLTMLDRLDVYERVPDDIDTQWIAPPNVKFFEIHGMNKVGCLNRVIQQLKKLQALSFRSCVFDEEEWEKLPWEDLKALRRLEFVSCNFKSLPERCRHLPAIEHIFVLECIELTCLPTWVSRLKSFEIYLPLPELEEKCRKPVGSYWSLLQDIPHFIITPPFEGLLQDP